MPPDTPRTTRGRPPGETAVSWVSVMGPVRSLAGGAGVGGGSLSGGLLGGELGRVDVLADEQVVVDLAQGDRERLLLDMGVHERADVLEQALTELRVVGVDLPGALGAEENQLVLAVGLGQQVVD